MESLSSETKGIALDILEDILSAIEKLEERTIDIHSIDDFYGKNKDVRSTGGRYCRLGV